MSFGCDLAPSLLEERKRGRALKGDGTDHSGWSFQEDKHKLNQGELGCRKRMRGGCGMQAEEAGYLRH